MTMSASMRAFLQKCMENHEKLGLIFDVKHVFETLGGQTGLKIGMYIQSNDV